MDGTNTAHESTTPTPATKTTWNIKLSIAADGQPTVALVRDDQPSPAKDTSREVRTPMEVAPADSRESATQPDPATKTSWTIMLYIAADSLLANFAVESLKQLSKSASTAPGHDDQASVVVAAQFSIDAPGGQTIKRYIFNESSGEGGNLGDGTQDPLNAPANMSEQQALTSFLKWVYNNPTCNQSEHYALILWSHGPELFLQPPPGDPTGDPASLYLTPQELREALTLYKPPTRPRLDIVGFDACSMSMFEMAYEIRDLADYMVASQEEVPDPSFPYDQLITLFRKLGKYPDSLLEQGVQAYACAYRDCICNANTGMKQVTLSALRLNKCDGLKNAVDDLASALLDAQNDGGLPGLLIEARKQSRDYAGGLYVDLDEFCTKLRGLLDGSEFDVKPPTWAACKGVLDALVERTSDSLILINVSAEARNHGISIYLPYLSDDQSAEVDKPMVKGGRETVGKGGRETVGKGFSVSDLLNNAAIGYRNSARQEMILDTEGYYPGLRLVSDKSKPSWYDFIAGLWPRILIKTAPAELDLRYSARQGALNLLSPGPADMMIQRATLNAKMK
jgi:Clostripain family